VNLATSEPWFTGWRATASAPSMSGSTMLGGALGLAIFSALATTRSHDLLASHAPVADALTGGFRRALLAGSLFILASAFIALRATNTRGEVQPAAEPATPPEVQRVAAYARPA
jgi:hypothetical protein